MILFKPDGTEITRLPGEVDADQYMRVLAMGMNGARPVKDTLAAALAPGRSKLTPEEWRLLAYYSWDTDEQQVLPKDKVPATLQRLAQACPADQRETAARLEIKALAAAATARGVKPRDDPAASTRCSSCSRSHGSRATTSTWSSTTAATSPRRTRCPNRRNARSSTRLGTRRSTDCSRDTSLSTGDRLSAVDAQVTLARARRSQGRAARLRCCKSVREQAARVDRDTTDPYARQAVISSAAEVLADAGLLDESDAMLKAELKRSHSPYYYMLGLAANAKTRGDKAAALDWYEKAYAAADGPATRLQWGASYVNALVDLSPQDVARIDAATKSVIGELDPAPDTFYGRNQRALETHEQQACGLGQGPRAQRDASLKRLRTQMASVCAQASGGGPGPRKLRQRASAAPAAARRPEPNSAESGSERTGPADFSR